jgi:hypothetical protein
MGGTTGAMGGTNSSRDPQGRGMAAKVHRLRPKRHDRIAEALQLVLELPLEPPARTALTDALSTYSPTVWVFTMLNRL